MKTRRERDEMTTSTRSGIRYHSPKDLTPHPQRNLVPDMRPDEWSDFYNDVAFRGVKTPIEVDAAGVILDGHHRHRAATELGLSSVPVIDATLAAGEDGTTYMLKAAVLRRHLTDDQRAEVARRWKDEHKQPTGAAAHGNSPERAGHLGVAAEQASDLFKTKRWDLDRATYVANHAPDLSDQIFTGSIRLTDAYRRAKGLDRDQRRAANSQLVERTPEPDGKFHTIVIDPPWDWGDEGDVDQYGTVRPAYQTMPYESIEALPISERCEANAHIYLWITNRSLPKGFRLLEAWGFRYITLLTWCKPSVGVGNYYRGSTEHVLFGVKGSQPLLRKDIGTWFEAPRGTEHSAKPESFYDMVESASPGPWLDMFARRQRPGWAVWGAEAC